MAKAPVIKASNLSKNFKLGKTEITALHSVNFEIYSGEFICFFGPSGCGKSTLLSMLAGLQPPTFGEVTVRGKNLANMSRKELSEYRRSKIGMVFQQFNLILSMNILENIALPMAFGGMNRRRRLQRAEHLLEVVGLGDKKHEIPADLSGGQQQRVAVARSLINNPWIIMADEPTGNLDSKSADDVMRLLISLNRKSKRTVILITHNPDYLQYADRIFRMKDGHIEKFEVNAKKSSVELMDSVGKLDKLKEDSSTGEETEEEKTEIEKTVDTLSGKDSEKKSKKEEEMSEELTAENPSEESGDTEEKETEEVKSTDENK